MPSGMRQEKSFWFLRNTIVSSAYARTLMVRLEGRNGSGVTFCAIDNRLKGVDSVRIEEEGRKLWGEVLVSW